ncbi:MAG: hypothetical protein PHD58_03415 [Anaerolineales bacterium]|nr:hypothetical protein [Anaerolineales bacterium]
MRRAEQPHASERWRVETGEPLRELALPKGEARPNTPSSPQLRKS